MSTCRQEYIGFHTYKGEKAPANTHKVPSYCESLILWHQEKMLRWILPPIILALAVYPFLPKQVDHKHHHIDFKD